MRLKTDIFPINYFKSIWTPLTAFKNRFELSWFQLIIVLIFLNALMVIPVTMNYAALDSFPLEEFYPKAVQVVDEQTVETLNQVEYSEGEMLFPSSFQLENKEGIVAGGVPVEALEETVKEQPFLLFEKNQFQIGEEGAPTATVLYTKDFSLEDAKAPEDVVNELSRQWFNQNRLLIVLVFSLLIGVFLWIMTLLLTFGSAFILYLTKKGHVTTITTYKESVHLIINSLGVSTLVAMILGLFYFDIYLMVTIQTIGLVIYLLVIFSKVQFNDQKLEELELRAVES